VTYHETADWTNGSTTPQELVLEPDDIDPATAEHYGMLVVPLDPVGSTAPAGFAGLLYVYATPPGQGQPSGAAGVLGECPQKYAGGRLQPQLTFSRNGRHWQRTLRAPLIANEFGGPTAGVVTPTSTLQLSNGSIILICSATRREHGTLATAFPADSAILTYRLRPDGWVALQSAGGVGYVGTRVFFLRVGPPLVVNVNSEHGAVRAQMTDHRGDPLPGFTYDDCEPFSGDDVAWVPRWASNNTAPGRWQTSAALNNTVVRLELELLNARVYAISANLVPMQAVQVTDWLQTGKPPKPRPGF